MAGVQPTLRKAEHQPGQYTHNETVREVLRVPREQSSRPRILAVEERLIGAAVRGHDLQSTFEMIAAELQDSVSHDHAALLTVQDVHRNFQVKATAGTHPGGLEPGAQLPMSEAAAGSASGPLAAAIYLDTRLSSDWLDWQLAEAGICSAITLPLSTQATGSQLLVLGSGRANQYSCEDMVWLDELGGAICASLRHCWRRALNVTRRQRRAEDSSVREHYRLVTEVSRGVVHSLNNALASVLGNTQLLAEETDDEQLAGRLERMEARILGGTQMLWALQEFVQNKETGSRETVNLGGLAQEIIDLIRPVWEQRPDDTTIEVKHQQQEGIAVLADRADIQQALIHIFFNALQAVPSGGEIAVTEGYDEDQAFVQVADNGVGMDRETWRRATEPFFTTRGDYSRGLGLSVASSIAGKHGGHISIASKPGEGSVVRMSVGLLGMAESVR